MFLIRILGIAYGSSYNEVINSDFHHNYDSKRADGPGNHANGMYIYDGDHQSTGNVIRGCRAWWNTDDGFDLYGAEGGAVIEESNWSFWNGYVPGSFTPVPAGNGNGFKLGLNTTGPHHTIRRNLAFENREVGFDANDSVGAQDWYNNTAYNNRYANFQNLAINISTPHRLRNNLAFSNNQDPPDYNSLAPMTDQQANAWNLPVTVTSADFISLNSAGSDGPRQTDGSLPNLSFLRLATDSDLIDKGVNVGLPYNGNAPDLGAFESSNTPPSPPLAPSQLVAVILSATQINLSWRDNSTNETGFKIERCSGSATCTSFAQIATTGANVASYSNAGLMAKTIYRYRVRATNAAGNSAYSDIVTITTPTAITSPSNLVATAASNNQISLTWKDNSTNEGTFVLDRCQGNNCTTFATIFYIGQNTVSFQDTNLSTDTMYCYRIRAQDINGFPSAYSNIACAKTLGITTPSNLQAAAISSKQVNLSWSDNSTNETGFKIERCSGSATCTNFAQIATTGANIATYTNMNLTTKTTYRYRVRATNAAGISAYSNIATITTP